MMRLYATKETPTQQWKVYDDGSGQAYIVRTGRDARSWHAVGPHRTPADWVAIQTGRWTIIEAGHVHGIPEAPKWMEDRKR